ncbi:MAG: FAD:protein FMN transferase [Thermoanaerobaculia bacterium]
MKLLAAGSVLFLAACCAVPPRTQTVDRRVMLMGTSLEIEVEAADRAAGLAASERAVAALETAESRLSTWRADTELARLNRTPTGEPAALSSALARDLAAARRCWQETAGAFDPGVGALVRAWGLRTGGRLPGPAERRPADGIAWLRLQPEGSAVREKDLILEEGGWGKGAGLADAMAALAAAGVTRAALDLGGQVAVLGTWEIPVADPRRRDRSVLALSVDGGSVSTSGNGVRGVHILDPRTGDPAPDFGSLTVWTADPLRADCLSTGLYVLGPQRAMAWAAAHPGVEVLVLQPSGGRLLARASPGLRRKLRALNPEIEIEF